MQTHKFGFQAKLFFGEAGQTAATEIGNVKDVELSLQVDEVDVTTRAANGWKAYATALKDGSITFDMLWNTTDPAFQAIKQAFMSGEAIALFVSDGDGNGLDADFVVTNFTRNEHLTDAMSVSVSCKPTMITRAPEWVDGQSS